MTTTSVTTTVTYDYNQSTNRLNNDENFKRMLAYTIPLSCLGIVVVILVAIGICKRRHVMRKWMLFKQMRNTNPKFYHTTGLRRDSEFDSFDQDDVQPPTTNGREYSLSTVF